ncbi:MAG TPA: methyltransferase domain-containing protein [Myxococcota bacterium]|nr:methyltransferase domain-containing protein [Myxococcota bacterium]
MEPAEPAPFFLAQAARVREASLRGVVCDLATGRGRHALAAAGLGARVVAIDRSREALRELAARAASHALAVSALRADLETPHGIPLRPGSCGAILVFRFLFRPLARAIVECLAPGGLLLYETFTLQQREAPYGPKNPAFLLEPGELAALFAGLEILSSSEGWTAGPRPEALARLAARKPGP